MASPGKLVIKDQVKYYGSFKAIDGVSLTVEEGQFLSLLGPSGCGKTTMLRLIAGFERPDEGEIVVDGRILSSAKGVVPPERRSMGMVFQSYAVWPHMTVFDNVAYGLRIRRLGKADIEQKVSSILDLVGMGHLSDRYPTQLSGGQQQRVALARALVTEPDILLLDEPLSNLDAKLRESMRFEIRSLQKRVGITTIYVTHSQEEALAASDKIAVMRDGRILQLGDPESVYHYPRTRFVADFIGLANFVEGRIAERVQKTAKVQLLEGSFIRAYCPLDPPDPNKVTVMIRPEIVSLRSPGESTTDNSLAGTIKRISFTGNVLDYFVQIDQIQDELRVQSTPPRRYKEGDKVQFCFSTEGALVLEVGE